jgi:hypothetical protein
VVFESNFRRLQNFPGLYIFAILESQNPAFCIGFCITDKACKWPFSPYARGGGVG